VADLRAELQRIETERNQLVTVGHDAADRDVAKALADVEAAARAGDDAAYTSACKRHDDAVRTKSELSARVERLALRSDELRRLISEAEQAELSNRLRAIARRRQEVAPQVEETFADFCGALRAYIATGVEAANAVPSDRRQATLELAGHDELARWVLAGLADAGLPVNVPTGPWDSRQGGHRTATLAPTDAAAMFATV